jgi:hypothetical protein
MWFDFNYIQGYKSLSYLNNNFEQLITNTRAHVHKHKHTIIKIFIKRIVWML